jgi:hypothetical protein
MLSRQLITIAILLSASFLGRAQYRICPDTTCHQDYEWVTETLQGTEDGWNVTFTLNRVPQNPNDVEVFRNGVLLQDGDKKVSGRTVVFTAAQAPRPGDWLVARYRSVEPMSPNPSDASGPSSGRRFQDEVTIQAGRAALQNEQAKFQRRTSPPIDTRGVPLLQDAERRSSSGVAMLERRVEHRDESHYSDYLTTQADTVGIDGLGDTAPSRSYTKDTETSNSGYATRHPEESQAASVRMLERMLAQNDGSLEPDGSLLRRELSAKHRRHSKKGAFLQGLWRSGKE